MSSGFSTPALIAFFIHDTETVLTDAPGRALYCAFPFISVCDNCIIKEPMMENTFSIKGQIVDLANSRIFSGTVMVEQGRVAGIRQEAVSSKHYIMPGFIDAHVHIESSMLVPSEFARLAVPHGTVGSVSDPHEIANVLGIDGVRFMIANARQSPFKFCFGVPSCVPATPFESNGGALSVREITELLALPETGCLSEMMNFPGVLQRDETVMAKIAAARIQGKPIDGHGPGLTGDKARRYIEAGITTDHECITLEEARDKIRFGMKVIIREGSAAKNFDTLIPILNEFPHMVMFCSDDKHPDNLIKGHINELVRRAIAFGCDPLQVFTAACKTPVEHYRLGVGMLRPGDPADFIVVENLQTVSVLATYLDGIKTAKEGKTLLKQVRCETPNHFVCRPVFADILKVRAETHTLRVIDVVDGELITKKSEQQATVEQGVVKADIKRDILKLVVLNRYQARPPAIAFVRNMGLKRGAIASSVAHDSHNIIAVGTNDQDLAEAINLIVAQGGGISAARGTDQMILPLPVAGIMSAEDGYRVAGLYRRLDEKAREFGSHLGAPFMTLSFLALLVIPELKLSDQGLFDVNAFQFTSLFV